MLSLNQRYQAQLKTVQKRQYTIYDVDEDLVNPDIPLEQHLKLLGSVTANSLFPKIILQEKHPEIRLNTSEDIRVVQLKKNKDPSQWIAIRSPRIKPQSPEELQHYHTLYENNLNMYLKLRGHTSFASLHAVCIKQNIPFLILPYYTSSSLALENSKHHLEADDKVNLLKRVKYALLHLHDCSINPHGLSLNNIMRSNGHEIKIMHFDTWHEEPDQAKLALQLYAAACTITTELALKFSFNLPVLNLQHLTSKSQLAQCLAQCIDTLIDTFEEAEYQYNNRISWW